jgi:hypothetical protein
MHPVREDTPDLPAQGHPPVITHLCRSKRLINGPPPAPILPVTPKCYRSMKEATRNILSPPLVRSSPYTLYSIQIYSPLVLSLYKFDNNFYQQGNILNGNIDVDFATYSSANNRYIKALRVSYQCIIDSAKLDEYKPLKMSNPPRPICTHLPDSADIKDPGSFFDIFVNDNDFEEIVTNTNKYTEQYSVRYSNTSQRDFELTNRIEIKVYFAILIYIDIHRIHNPKEHWNNPARLLPI